MVLTAALGFSMNSAMKPICTWAKAAQYEKRGIFSPNPSIASSVNS